MYHKADKRLPGFIFPGRATALALLLLVAGCVHTVPFRDANGHIIPHSIATMETVTIGGKVR
ncbi:MAG: hypothetical protein ACREUM_08370 [Nitrosospira sp.]